MGDLIVIGLHGRIRPLGIVRGVRGGVDLDVLGIVNLLAGVDVDKEGHHTILYALALFALGVTSGFGLLAFDARSIPIRAYIRKSTAGQRDGVLKRGGPRQCVAQAIGFWRANEDTKSETAPARGYGAGVAISTADTRGVNHSAAATKFSRK
jgi:hypothetical protein